MTKKKGCLIALGLGVCVGLGAIGLALLLTGPAVQSANRFLALLRDGKVHEAYQSTSNTLKARLDERAFASTVQGLGLMDYASSSWTSRSVENNQASLEGTVTTKEGGAIPIKMRLIKEEGGWKIFAIEGAAAGIRTGAPKKQVPPDEELQQLVKQTLLDFNQAVRSRDFGPFRDKASVLLQRQASTEDFAKNFHEFVDKGLDITPIKDLAAVFDEPPTIDDKGLLILSGYYPTKPERVLFRLEYTYEHPAWKLLSISVRTRE